MDSNRKGEGNLGFPCSGSNETDGFHGCEIPTPSASKKPTKIKNYFKNKITLKIIYPGGMAEWSKALAWSASVRL